MLALLVSIVKGRAFPDRAETAVPDTTVRLEPRAQLHRLVQLVDDAFLGRFVPLALRRQHRAPRANIVDQPDLHCRLATALKDITVLAVRLLTHQPVVSLAASVQLVIIVLLAAIHRLRALLERI